MAERKDDDNFVRDFMDGGEKKDNQGPNAPNRAELDDGPEVSGEGDLALRAEVIAALREVYDPEIPLNVYDLGLIYRISIESNLDVSIDMTLTSPNCPVAGSLPGEVENAAQSVDGVGNVSIDVVWEPPWDMDRMGEAAKLQLGLL